MNFRVQILKSHLGKPEKDRIQLERPNTSSKSYSLAKLNGRRRHNPGLSAIFRTVLVTDVGDKIKADD